MNPDIWIVRDGDVYRLLHGHLHLAIELIKQGDVFVDIKNEGKLKVVRTSAGLAVERDSRRSPLRTGWERGGACISNKKYACPIVR